MSLLFKNYTFIEVIYLLIYEYDSIKVSSSRETQTILMEIE